MPISVLNWNRVECNLSYRQGRCYQNCTELSLCMACLLPAACQFSSYHPYIFPTSLISFLPPLYPSYLPYILPTSLISFQPPLYPSNLPYILPTSLISFLPPLYPSWNDFWEMLQWRFSINQSRKFQFDQQRTKQQKLYIRPQQTNGSNSLNKSRPDKRSRKIKINTSHTKHPIPNTFRPHKHAVQEIIEKTQQERTKK